METLEALDVAIAELHRLRQYSSVRRAHMEDRWREAENTLFALRQVLIEQEAERKLREYRPSWTMGASRGSREAAGLERWNADGSEAR